MAKTQTKEEIMQKEISTRLSKAGFGPDEFKVELRGVAPARPNILISILCPLERIILLSKAIVENGITLNVFVHPKTYATESIVMQVEMHWVAKMNVFTSEKKSLFSFTKEEKQNAEKELKSVKGAA